MPCAPDPNNPGFCDAPPPPNPGPGPQFPPALGTPPASGGQAQVSQGCLPGYSTQPNCIPYCFGDMSMRSQICANTFCQLISPPPGVEGVSRLQPCPPPIGYQPQYPPLPASPPLPAVPANSNFQLVPPGSACPPGQVLDCADAFQSGARQITPGFLPLVEEGQPYSIPAVSQAIPQLMSVAVEGLDQLTAAVSQGFANVTQQLADQLTVLTLPVVGTAERQMDALQASLDKLDGKINQSLNGSLAEAIGYAAQLGVPQPSQADFDTIAAGTPLSSYSPPAADTQSFGSVPQDVLSNLSALQEMPFDYNSCQTLGYFPNLGSDSAPCGIINKDCKNDGVGQWFLIPGSRCPPTGSVPNPPTPTPIITPTPTPTPSPTPPIPAPGGTLQTTPGCTIGGVPFGQVQQNADGSITIVDQNGTIWTVDPQSPLISCPGQGGGGAGGGPGGGGILLPSPGGGPLPGPSPYPPTPIPGGGGYPGGTCTAPPGTPVTCPPSSGSQQIINIPAQPPGGGNLNVTVQPPNTIVNNPAQPPASIVVNVPPPQPPPPPPPQPFSTDVASENPPSIVDFNASSTCPAFQAIATATALTTGEGTLSSLGFNGSGSNPIVPTSLAPLMETTPWWFPNSLVWGLAKSITNGMQATAGVIPQWTSCAVDFLKPLVFTQMVSGWIRRILGGGTEILDKRLELTRNLLCPSMPPSAGEADAAYLSGDIDTNTWKCWVRANDVCENPHSTILHSRRTRPQVTDVITLYLRGELDDSGFRNAMRNLGVMDDTDFTQFKKLTRFIPGAANVLGSMAGNRFDDSWIQKGDLDNGFDARYTGDAKDWLTAAGVDQPTALHLWRAHWSTPEFSSLIDMLFRLTPEKNDPAGVMTIDDVKSAMTNIGIAPGWQDKMIAVARPRITLREVRNLIVYSGWREDKVKVAFTDMGYPDDKATDLAHSYVTTALKAAGAYAGLPTESEIVKLYQDDGITTDKATEILKQLGHTDDGAKAILSTADATIQAQIRANKVKAIRKRYMMGEYADGDALSQLQTAGLTFDHANQRVLGWAVEKELDHKLPSAQQLCSLYTDGFIDPPTYFKRMQNLGWGDTDAYAFVNQCATKDLTKKAAELKKQLKEQQAAADKAAAKIAAAQKAAAAKAKADFPCAAPKKPTCPPGIVPPDGLP